MTRAEAIAELSLLVADGQEYGKTLALEMGIAALKESELRECEHFCKYCEIMDCVERSDTYDKT